MKASEIRALNGDQKVLALSDLSKQVVQLRIQAATERLQSLGQIREARKDIARVKTIQREAELVSIRAAAEKAAAEAGIAHQKAYTDAVAHRKELKRLNEEGVKRAKENPKSKGKKGDKSSKSKAPKSAAGKNKGK
jgi:large subunit ribosomal protein L29